MSLFNPASSPQVMAGGLVVWSNIFTSAELDAMERYGDRLALEKAELAARNSGRDSIRVTKVAWFERNAETGSVFMRGWKRSYCG